MMNVRCSSYHALLLVGFAALLTALTPAEMATKPVFESFVLTPAKAFTFGIEGVSADLDGAVYALNLKSAGTVARLSPNGLLIEFVRLPDGGIGNGSRIGPGGMLYIADYKRHRVHRIDLKSGTQSVAFEGNDMHQPNDLAITDDGTLFASDPQWRKRRGRVWRLSPKAIVELAPDSGTANGIELSPDGRTLYVGESTQKRIVAYDLNAAGELSNKRTFFSWKDDDVDGIRADLDGRLFLARNGRGTIDVVDASGKLTRSIGLKGKNPTNLAFGGTDGRTVFIAVRDKGWIEAFRTDVAGREWRQQQSWRQ